MGRRLKLANPPRYEATAPRCVVKLCDTTPPVGALVCVPHAQALAKLATTEVHQ